MKYSFDTSGILEPWLRHYPLDVFPAVWEKVDELVATGRAIATVEVLKELERKDDDVAKWAKARKDMFVPIDWETQTELRRILGNYPRLVDTRKSRSGADPWVIALAATHGCAVVTYEKPSGNIDKLRIPDVCRQMGIEWMDLLGVFRSEGWRFGA